MDFSDNKLQAKPLVEVNMYGILEMFYSVLSAAEEYNKFDAQGAYFGLHKIKSRINKLFLLTAPMIKRSVKPENPGEESTLYQSLLNLSDIDDYDDIQKIIMNLSCLLDEKNITKVDIREVRKKRGVAIANAHKQNITY